MDSNHEENNPTAADAAAEPKEPPAFKPPDRSLLQQTWTLPPGAREKLIKYNADMAKPGATTTYLDDDDDEVTRPLKPRETGNHISLLHTFGTLAVNQQKLDAATAELNGDNQELSLKDFVTEYSYVAGARIHNEAVDLGLDCAAAVPDERCQQIFDEEWALYHAANPPKSSPGQKKPFEIPLEQRNDWVIPQETQAAVMTRLVDMALPCGKEYHRIKPKARLMAGRLIGRLCRLGQQQHFVNLRGHVQKPQFDWEAATDELNQRMAEHLEARRREMPGYATTVDAEGRPFYVDVVRNY